MNDRLQPEERSALMGRVRGKNTLPEIRVRKVLHGLGYRFRLHRRDLPGKPDIVLPKYRLCVFVNGCFWHQHPGCHRATMPRSNKSFWKEKLTRNCERDRKSLGALRELGWKTLVVWECETFDTVRLQNTLLQTLKRLFKGRSPG